MRNRELIILVAVCLVVIFCIVASATYYLFPSKTVNESNGMSPQVIGSTSYGNVVKDGPYGNNSSKV